MLNDDDAVDLFARTHAVNPAAAREFLRSVADRAGAARFYVFWSGGGGGSASGGRTGRPRTLLAFPSAWLAAGVAGWALSGPLVGALATLLSPLSGVAALRLREALQVLRRSRPTMGLIRQREALAAMIREVAAAKA